MNLVSKIWFNFLLLFFGKNTPIYILFLLDKMAGGSLPCHYTASEKYFIWVDYLNRRANGKKCTFNDIEKEYFDDWKEESEKIRKDNNL